LAHWLAVVVEVIVHVADVKWAAVAPEDARAVVTTKHLLVIIETVVALVAQCVHHMAVATWNMAIDLKTA